MGEGPQDGADLILDHGAAFHEGAAVIDECPPGGDVRAGQMHGGQLIEVQEGGEFLGVEPVVLAAVAKEPGDAAGIGDLDLGGQGSHDGRQPLGLGADLEGDSALAVERPQNRLDSFDGGRDRGGSVLAVARGSRVEEIEDGVVNVNVHSYSDHGVFLHCS